MSEEEEREAREGRGKQARGRATDRDCGTCTARMARYTGVLHWEKGSPASGLKR